MNSNPKNRRLVKRMIGLSFDNYYFNVYAFFIGINVDNIDGANKYKGFKQSIYY